MLNENEDKSTTSINLVIATIRKTKLEVKYRCQLLSFLSSRNFAGGVMYSYQFLHFGTVFARNKLSESIISNGEKSFVTKMCDRSHSTGLLSSERLLMPCKQALHI
jgi:hypothetical protein